MNYELIFTQLINLNSRKIKNRYANFYREIVRNTNNLALDSKLNFTNLTNSLGDLNFKFYDDLTKQFMLVHALKFSKQKNLKPSQKKALQVLGPVRNIKTEQIIVKRIVEAVDVNNGKKTTENKITVAFEKYLDDNKKFIEDVARQYRENEEVIFNEKVVNETSKNIIKDRKKLINKTVFDEELGIDRPLTNEEIQLQLQNKYGATSYRLERILKTETHSLEEQTALSEATLIGFTHKRYKTNPQDSKSGPRVSKDANHKVLNGQVRKIDEDFDFGKGIKAPSPGHTSLNAVNRINCVCSQEFFNQ